MDAVLTKFWLEVAVLIISFLLVLFLLFARSKKEKAAEAEQEAHLRKRTALIKIGVAVLISLLWLYAAMPVLSDIPAALSKKYAKIPCTVVRVYKSDKLVTFYPYEAEVINKQTGKKMTVLMAKSMHYTAGKPATCIVLPHTKIGTLVYDK